MDDLGHYIDATSRMRQRAEQAEDERDKLRDAIKTFVEAARTNGWADVLCDGRFSSLEDSL